jgi:hypothetical protein
MKLLPIYTSILLVFVAAIATSSAASARTLSVGTGRAFLLPSAAAAVAQQGDTISIAQGSYFDCAVWQASDLTIRGEGTGAIFTGKTCQGKAIFVTVGANITVSNITFMNAVVPDNNGAGIRAEGPNLTVDRSSFIQNQDGILTDADPTSTIVITNSKFLRNGACITSCAHGIYIGQIKEVIVENTVFQGTRVGHHVKSRALRTEIINSSIQDGTDGTSSYLVDLPNGGDLVLVGSVLEKGPHTSNRGTAISIGEEGNLQPVAVMLVENNRFTNDTTGPTTFVNNLTGFPATLLNNSLRGLVTPLTGAGTAQ